MSTAMPLHAAGGFQREFENLIGGRTVPLVTVVVTLLVVGVLLWLVNTYVPMQGTIKGILNAVVVIVVVLWIMNAFGLYHYITQFRVGQQ
jgi:type IV secretory pathway TrbD component